MRRVGVLLFVILVSGCYTLQPVASTQPLLGTVLALDINDQGRAVLGGTIGPEIGQIEGRLVSKDNAEYVLAVNAVRFLRGGEQTWTGERVHVKNEFVTAVRERKFSKGRTAILSGAAIGVVAAIITRSIVGSGQAEPIKPPGDSSAQSIRIPIPLHR